MTIRLIDPPSPFDPVEDWKKFLREMKSLPQDATVKEYVKLAEDEIQRHKDSQR